MTSPLSPRQAKMAQMGAVVAEIERDMAALRDPSAADQVDERAHQLLAQAQAQGLTLTYEEAMRRVLAADPNLALQYRREMNPAAHQFSEAHKTGTRAY